MEAPRPDSLEAVAARVAAWHNRHPLARRITADQVQSVGYVALPYLPPATRAEAAAAPAAAAAEAPAGGSLRERAMARAKPAAGEAPAIAPKDPARRRLQAAFSEDFIAPLSPRRVARWAARHGVALDAAPRGAPLRQVEPDAAFASQARSLQTLYVLTAMVESRGKRVRMLLSPSSDRAVLGGRLWSPPRVAGGSVAALGGLAAVGLAIALWWQAAPPPPSATATAGPTQEAPVGAGTPAPHRPSIKPGAMRSAARADTGLAAPAGVASAASGAALPPPRPAPPIDVEPSLGRINLPALGLPRGDEARAAARERRLASQAPPGVIPVAPQSPQPAPAAPAVATPAASAPVAVAASVPAAPPQPTTAAAPPPGQAFALSSRRLRTRAESEQTVAAVRALLAGAGHQGLQVEVVPAGEDWRVVGWPFAQRAQAEKARALLATRGIRLEVVDF